ncbi:glycosyltransferase family 39 protein [Bacteroidota bacterium]
MVSISNDYGITNDEPLHHLHGKLIYDYYFNGDSIASLSPINSADEIVQTFSPVVDENIRGMNFFGGFFDFVVAIGNKMFHSKGEYEIRHLINAIFGFLCILFIGLLAKEFAGWRAALLALLFAVLTPRLFGHSFNNPKDIPFATFYIISIYQIILLLKELPKFKIKRILFLVLLIAVSISIRVSGLLLIFYLFIFVFVYWLIPAFKDRFNSNQIRIGVRLAAFTIGIGIISYLTTALFWPYMHSNILAPITVLKKVSNFEVFNSYELFNGSWINAWEIPWYYIPKWILITVPVSVLSGLFLSILPFFQKQLSIKGVDLMRYSFLIFTIIFPVFYIIFKGSNVYNGVRHLLFVFPSIIVCSSLAWDYLIRIFKPSFFYFSTLAVLAFFLFQPLIWMISNHPYQSMYFSPVIGGNEGAFKTYETDYWGVSTKEAIKWINDSCDIPDGKQAIGIKMFYGERIKVTYYTDNLPKLEYIPGNGTDKWDYEIVYTAAAKFNPDLLLNWPPEGTVYEIKAGGSPLCAIVKNQFQKQKLVLEEEVKQNPNSTNLIQLSLQQYTDGKYTECIHSCERVLELEPQNITALNNICSAYNSMKMYDKAEKYCQKAIEISPDFELAKNNLLVAQEGLKSMNNSNLSVNEYLNLSVNYYMHEDYQACINMSKKAIELDPLCANAYNNICSAHNVLGNFKLAKKACEKALEINPDFELAKNNLNVAINGLENNK